MRVSRRFLPPALALATASAPAAPSAEPSRQLVVMSAAAPPAAADPAAAGELPPRLAARIASLGLRALAALADRLPARPAARPSGNPFDLDPSRVWLLEAPDPGAARAAGLALADDPDVAWVEPNRVREPALAALDPAFPDDPLFRDSRQWGLRNVGPAGAYGGIAGADVAAPEAWALSTGSRDLRLAVADTGIDPDHPDLQAVLPSGGARIELGIDVTAGAGAAYADSFGHGTPVAGVMAARTGEGAHFDSLGVAGMCGGDGRDNPGCRLVPIKITPGRSGGAASFDIARAIVYATDVGARAMNLSFAGTGPSRLERLALYYAITRGCVVVAASGNHGGARGDAPQYPAAYAVHGLCIQVGASDPSDRLAPFSSHGPGLDLVAPGVDVWTTFLTYPSAMGAVTNGYVAGSGTSFAAPFVTGAVGLLAAARPELADADFQRLLRESADDVGEPGVDARTGWGRLDAARALRAVGPEFGIWHDEVAAETFLSRGEDSLVVGEAGPGSMDRVRRWPRAGLIEATATVAVPDSFLEPPRVWPRVGGTMTVAAGFRLPYFAPWAEVAASADGAFTLRGYLYRLADRDGPDEDGYLPLPPSQARFGFTAIGRVDRPPALEVLAPAGPFRAAPGESLRVSWRASDPDRLTAIEVWLDGGGGGLRLARLAGDAETAEVVIPCPAPFSGPGALRVAALDEHGPRHDRADVAVPLELASGACPRPVLAIAPNPSAGWVRLSGPAGARLAIADLAGRVVRRAALDPRSGDFAWDGRDAAGRTLAPGVYLVAVEGAGAPRKLLRLR